MSSSAPSEKLHEVLPKSVRTVAIVEAAKGLVVLLLGFGLLEMVDDAVQAGAVRWLRHFYLNPAKQEPRIFLDALEHADDTRLRLLAAAALAYALLRFVETYGLWTRRPWAAWVAVISAALYLPLEVHSLTHGVTPVLVVTLLLNLVVVAFLGVSLWRAHQNALRKRAAHQPDR